MAEPEVFSTFMLSRRVVGLFLAVVFAALPAAALRCELSCLLESGWPAEPAPSPVCAGHDSTGSSPETARSLPPGPLSPQTGCGGHFQAHGTAGLAAGKTPVVESLTEAGLLPASIPVLRGSGSGVAPLARWTACALPDPVRSHSVLRI